MVPLIQPASDKSIMELFENFTVGSFLVPLFLFVVVWILMFIWRRFTTTSNLPPHLNLLKMVWSSYRSGVPIYEYARRLKHKHGAIYTFNVFGQRVVCLNDFASIKEAFNNPHLNDRPNLVHDPSGGMKGVVLASGELWNQQRRFILRIFRKFGIGRSRFEGKIEDESGAVIEEIALHKGKPFDPNHLLIRAVSNVICSVIFGKRYEYSDDRFKYFLELSTRQLQMAVKSLPMLYIPALRYLPFGAKVLNEMNANGKKLQHFATDHIQSHKHDFNTEVHRDFIDSYLNEIHLNKEGDIRGKYSKLNEHSLGMTIMQLFGAGTDTTALSLRWGVLYMTRYPDIQTAVQKEIDAVVGRNKLPKLADKPFLKYTQAVILEMQRMASISRFGGFHSCKETTTVQGWTIPQGAIVVSNLWAVHRDPDLWSDPCVFKPERFLNDKGEVCNREELIPFSIGHRMCIGEPLALMELYIFFTHLMHQFRFEGCTSEPGKTDFSDDQGRNPKDFKVRAIKRE